MRSFESREERDLSRTKVGMIFPRAQGQSFIQEQEATRRRESLVVSTIIRDGRTTIERKKERVWAVSVETVVARRVALRTIEVGFVDSDSIVEYPK